MSAQDKIINALAAGDIMSEESQRTFYILSNLPNTDEWGTYAFPLELTEKAERVLSIVTHLLSFETHLHRARNHTQDTI
jgi:hypothetical protein